MPSPILKASDIDALIEESAKGDGALVVPYFQADPEATARLTGLPSQNQIDLSEVYGTLLNKERNKGRELRNLREALNKRNIVSIINTKPLFSCKKKEKEARKVISLPNKSEAKLIFIDTDFDISILNRYFLNSKTKYSMKKKFSKAITHINKTKFQIFSEAVISHKNKAKDDLDFILGVHKNIPKNKLREKMNDQSYLQMRWDELNSKTVDLEHPVLSIEAQELANLPDFLALCDEINSIAEAIPPLPKRRLAEFRGGRGSDPIAHLQEHFGVWIDAGVLDWSYLSKNIDSGLASKIRDRCKANKKNNIKPDSLLDIFPPIAVARDNRTRLYGEDIEESLISTEIRRINREAQRKHQNSKKIN